MKKWQVLGVSAALCAVFAVSGCNQQSGGTQNKQEQNNAPVAKVGGSKPAKGVKIGFAHCCVYGEISTMDASEDAIRKMANERGATLIFESANESQNKDNNTIQVEQVKNMIDKGAKAIILISAQGKGAEQMQEEILEYAKSKGVPVVAAGRPLSPKLHTHFPDVISVGSSSEEAGTNQGKMAVPRGE